jgi:hypothetical protein
MSEKIIFGINLILNETISSGFGKYHGWEHLEKKK